MKRLSSSRLTPFVEELPIADGFKDIKAANLRAGVKLRQRIHSMELEYKQSVDLIDREKGRLLAADRKRMLRSQRRARSLPLIHENNNKLYEREHEGNNFEKSTPKTQQSGSTELPDIMSCKFYGHKTERGLCPEHTKSSCKNALPELLHGLSVNPGTTGSAMEEPQTSHVTSTEQLQQSGGENKDGGVPILAGNEAGFSCSPPRDYTHRQRRILQHQSSKDKEGDKEVLKKETVEPIQQQNGRERGDVPVIAWKEKNLDDSSAVGTHGVVTQSGGESENSGDVAPKITTDVSCSPPRDGHLRLRRIHSNERLSNFKEERFVYSSSVDRGSFERYRQRKRLSLDETTKFIF